MTYHNLTGRSLRLVESRPGMSLYEDGMSRVLVRDREVVEDFPARVIDAHPLAYYMAFAAQPAPVPLNMRARI